MGSGWTRRPGGKFPISPLLSIAPIGGFANRGPVAKNFGPRQSFRRSPRLFLCLKKWEATSETVIQTTGDSSYDCSHFNGNGGRNADGRDGNQRGHGAARRQSERRGHCRRRQRRV